MKIYSEKYIYNDSLQMRLFFLTLGLVPCFPVLVGKMFSPAVFPIWRVKVSEIPGFMWGLSFLTPCLPRGRGT